MKNEKEDKSEKDVIIDFGIGKVNFGGLLKNFSNLVDVASKLGEEGVKTSGTRKVGDKGKVVYGVTIKNLAGKTTFETFGNVKESEKGPVVEDYREPIVDVFDEEKIIKVIAEMPGISEKELKIEISGDILNINAVSAERKYTKEILLPCEVDEKIQKIYLKNGIFEILLTKKSVNTGS